MTVTSRQTAMTATVVPDGFSPLLVPQPYRVLAKVDEGPDIVTLHLRPVDGSLPTFRPAQVAMLGAFGVGEATISISSPVTDTDVHGYTIRRAGPITDALVDTPIGGVVTVRGPFGNAWPLDALDTGQLLIAAGGLGIAPLRAAIHDAVARSADFDRVSIVYGAKTPADLIYRDDLERWADDGAEVVLTVDDADEAWSGPIGVVPALLASADRGSGAAVQPAVDMAWADTTAFVCGPDVMMHFTALRLVELGVLPERIWITLERNMQCGNGLCGHCQLGPVIVCRDGPVVNYADIGRFHRVKGL